MDAAEIREMSIEDIQEELDDARESLMRLRFQLTTGELDRSHPDPADPPQYRPVDHYPERTL